MTDQQRTGHARGDHKVEETRASKVWVASIAALFLLLAVMIFVLQNGQRVRVNYLGLHSTLPLAVALLLSAVLGGLLVGLLGAVRMLQLRRSVGHHRRDSSARPAEKP